MARLVKVALVVLVPLFVLDACFETPPNPLAAGGTSGQTTAQGGSTGTGTVAIPADAGRPQPAPLATQPAALTMESAVPARVWPTADCPGGPCAAPNVCVNLDFTFVACVPCGGDDQVCCPSGPCDPGLTCAPNPNYSATPPLDLVRSVCQVPGSPPPADGGLNHQRVKLGL